MSDGHRPIRYRRQSGIQRVECSCGWKPVNVQRRPKFFATWEEAEAAHEAHLADEVAAA
jgi:hypothetical protein